MRLLTLLFSLYIACLSCLPCTDEAAVCVEQGASQLTVAATHADYGRASCGDWCSPLCQCHCCAGAVAPAGAVALLAHAPTLVWNPVPPRAHVVEYVPAQMPGGVWQPPRA